MTDELSAEAQRILAAMRQGERLVEHGYSFDEHDSDIWFYLGKEELESPEAVDELVDAGIIATPDVFANPMERVYEVLR